MESTSCCKHPSILVSHFIIIKARILWFFLLSVMLIIGETLLNFTPVFIGCFIKIVILVISKSISCGANRFILVDLGDAGRHSDGGVLSHSAFGKALETGSLPLPRPRPFPGTCQPDIPFVIVGDEAFPLKNYMMRPYPGRNLPGITAFFFPCVYNHNAVIFSLQRMQLYSTTGLVEPNALLKTASVY